MEQMHWPRKIRENERLSHTEIYTSARLYEEGSWLQKPVKTVMDILPCFQNDSSLRILDLGCGVGRNIIAIARHFPDKDCSIVCVDLLELAIQKLLENATFFRVTDSIDGVTCSIEDYRIAENAFDFILAVSALEHVECEESFLKKLVEIRDGIRNKGIVCLIMNSGVKEFDTATGKQIPAQFEVNLPTDVLLALLRDTFSGWNVQKQCVQLQRYEIPREHGISQLHTPVVTFVARK